MKQLPALILIIASLSAGAFQVPVPPSIGEPQVVDSPVPLSGTWFLSLEEGRRCAEKILVSEGSNTLRIQPLQSMVSRPQFVLGPLTVLSSGGWGLEGLNQGQSAFRKGNRFWSEEYSGFFLSRWTASRLVELFPDGGLVVQVTEWAQGEHSSYRCVYLRSPSTSGLEDKSGL